MKSFASIIVVCLAVIALSATVSAGGDHKGHKGKGHKQMWKMMMSCNGVNATMDSMKSKFEDCKNKIKDEGNGSGEEGEGGKGKKHGMWKKIHECVAKEVGMLNDDGSYKMEGVKDVLEKVYGAENGAKIADGLQKNCADHMSKKPEDKKQKWEMMKCGMKVYKEACNVQEEKKDEDM